MREIGTEIFKIGIRTNNREIKTNNWFFEKIDKIDKRLVRLLTKREDSK